MRFFVILLGMLISLNLYGIQLRGVDNLVVSGGMLYFSADDSIHGYELWVSDGTKSGTKLVKDIYADGSNSSGPRVFIEYNGKLFFNVVIGRERSGTAATAYRNIYQLWNTDGTESGTKAFMGADSRLTIWDPIVYNGKLFFGGHDSDKEEFQSLWVSNGTQSGTYPVLGNPTNSNNQNPTPPTINNAPAETTINKSVTISVTRGTDPDNDLVKIHCTATDSNYVNGSPFVSPYGTGGTNISTNPIFNFNSIGTKTIYCASFDDKGNASSVQTKTIKINSSTNTLPPTEPTISDQALDAKTGQWVNITVTRGVDPNAEQVKVECTSDYSDTYTSDYGNDEVQVQCVAEDSNWTTSSPYTSELLPNGWDQVPISFQFTSLGEKIISCISIDAAGAVSEPQTHTISVLSRPSNDFTSLLHDVGLFIMNKGTVVLPKNKKITLDVVQEQFDLSCIPGERLSLEVDLPVNISELSLTGNIISNKNPEGNIILPLNENIISSGKILEIECSIFGSVGFSITEVKKNGILLNSSVSELERIIFTPVFSQSFEGIFKQHNIKFNHKFDLDNALIGSTLSTLAYYNETFVKKTLSKVGMDLINFIDEGSHQAYLAMNPNFPEHFYIFIRGTEVVKDDIITDLSIIQTDNYHDGFYKLANAVMDVIDIPSIRSKKLFITGHSLGGAGAAVLTSLWLEKKYIVGSGDIQTYTFGAPRPFSPARVMSLNAKNIHNYLFTIRHRKDPVPTSPPESSAEIQRIFSENDIFFPLLQYSHSGEI